MGSSLEYKYSVTHGATKAASYSVRVRWILGGTSARSFGCKVRLVVGWVCGRGLYGCKSGNSVEIESHDGLFLGR